MLGDQFEIVCQAKLGLPLSTHIGHNDICKHNDELLIRKVPLKSI